MKQGQNTKQRLLDAARELFAERGYHNATVRDIALRARTNLASINYYFHSKDHLYREVVRSAFQTSVAPLAPPNTEATPDGGSPTENLRAFARLLIRPESDDTEAEKNRRLMAWEILSPTGAVETVEDWEIGHHLDRALNVVRRFRGQETAEGDTYATALWLIGQCLVFRKLFPHTNNEGPGAIRPTLGDFQIDDESLIDLIVARATSGISA